MEESCIKYRKSYVHKIEPRNSLHFVSSQCFLSYVFHCDVSPEVEDPNAERTYIFLIWSCIRIKGEVLRVKTSLSPLPATPHTPPPLPCIFPTDRAKADPLVQSFCFVISYVAFAVSLFVPHLSFVWCISRTVLRDCGISWVYLLILFVY